MDNEIFTYARAVLALVFVIGLIFLLAALVKKTGLDKRIIGNVAAKRIAVTETLYLDPKNRLVIVKKEGKEHLLLLSASGNLLIETRESGDKV